jgi:carbon monoxide dehydrogenase subunit G
MNLKGSYTLPTSAQVIWDKLMDTDTLARITPGVSKLEATGEDTYTAISQVKIGPVNGSFKGDLAIIDKQEPSSFTLQVKQNSKIGNVSADVAIQINAISDNETEVSFDGKAKLSGLLARTGQRVLSGVANTLSKQFFKALENELEAA